LEEFERFVQKLIKGFESTDLDFAFTGAVAVSFYGSPRTTSDVDIMVSVSGKVETKRKVADAMRQAGLEVNERVISRALSTGYNIVTFKDKASPYTVDIIFSEQKLEKQSGTVAGVKTFLQKPEGLILAKLRMIKVTVPLERAAKDREDVKSIMAFSKVNLDAVKKQARLDKTIDILENLME